MVLLQQNMTFFSGVEGIVPSDRQFLKPHIHTHTKKTQCDPAGPHTK